MFDFEKLKVYQKAKKANSVVKRWIKANRNIDRVTKDQLRRASLSIPLNIAEGTGRFTQKDRRHFYVTSRSSAFECVAIFDTMLEDGEISQSDFDNFYATYEELSKMLFSMIQKLS